MGISGFQKRGIVHYCRPDGAYHLTLPLLRLYVRSFTYTLLSDFTKSALQLEQRRCQQVYEPPVHEVNAQGFNTHYYI